MAKYLKRMLVLCLVLCISLFAGVFAAACDEGMGGGADNEQDQENGGNGGEEDEGNGDESGGEEDDGNGDESDDKQDGDNVGEDKLPTVDSETVTISGGSATEQITFTGAVKIEWDTTGLSGEYMLAISDPTEGVASETLKDYVYYVQIGADAEWKYESSSDDFAGICVDPDGEEKVTIIIEAPEGAEEVTINLTVSAKTAENE